MPPNGQRFFLRGASLSSVGVASARALLLLHLLTLFVFQQLLMFKTALLLQLLLAAQVVLMLMLLDQDGIVRIHH